MERGQCHCLASGGLPGTHPISSYFTHSPYVTGTPYVLVNPRVGGFVYLLRQCGPFKQSLLKIWQFLLPPQHHWFLWHKIMGIHLPHAGTLGCAVWHGAGITCSSGVPRCLYPPHLNVGPPILLPLHTSPCLSTSFRVSAPPTHLHERGFFKFLVVRLPYSLIF